MGLFHWTGTNKKSTGKPRLGMESLEDRLTPTVSFGPGLGSPIALANGSNPNGIVVADLNNDGFEDIATANSDGNNVAVLLGSQSGAFGSPSYTTVGTTPLDVIATDVNGDTILDLVVTNSSSTSVSVLIGDGDGTFQPAADFAAGTAPSSVLAGDFNGDTNVDLAVTDSSGNNVNILTGNGNGTFNTFVSYAVGTTPGAITAGFFNNDNLLDLAVANSGSNNVTVLIGQSGGTFSPIGAATTVGNTPIAIVSDDFNGDGIEDLATLNSGGGSYSIMLGTGSGTFSAPITTAVTGTGLAGMTLGDFNSDDVLDLAFTSSGTKQFSVLQGNGNGTFQTQQNFTISRVGTGIATGDFNNDGSLDVTIAGSTDDNVTTALNLVPSATLTSTNVTLPTSTYQFTVTYAGNPAINVSTISNTNILVTGPNGYSQLATRISVSSSTNGSPRTATYQITPPDGLWSFADNGEYVINIQPNQVATTGGVFVPGKSLGTFRVAITNEFNNLGVGYVQGLYQSILGRTGDAAGLKYWNGLLDGGAAKDTLFTGFWVSREHRTLQVQGYYRNFLNREADAAGLSFWVAKFAQGATESDVIQGFMGSNEYRNINGGTATSVISAIYNDLLGRTPSAGEIQLWASTFASNGSSAVAKGVVQSAEYQMDLVANDYIDFLNRPLVAQSEIDSNLYVITSKGPISEEDLAHTFAVSSEFINLTLEPLPT